MPGGDRTGPLGQGPMTGRGMGFCAGYDRPETIAYGRGLGRGMGRGPGMGRGRGWRRSYPVYGQWAAPAPQVETDLIREEIAALASRIDYLNRRLTELGTENKPAQG